MDLSQDSFQWRILVLEVLNIQFLLPQISLHGTEFMSFQIRNFTS